MSGQTDPLAANQGVALSLSLPVGYGIAPRHLVALIEYAEARGLAGVAVGELTSTDALAVLAAAAPSTSRIRLETSVLSVLTRSPAMLAMSAATMADLSAGRFVLGLGAGSPIVAGFHGEKFTDPVGRVERWLTDVRAALCGASLPEWGSFRLRGVPLNPVPLLLGAMNSRMLAVAGRAADGVIMNLCGPDQIRAQLATALAARQEARVDGTFEVHTTLWVDATGDIDRARDRFRMEMAPYLAVPTYRSTVVALVRFRCGGPGRGGVAGRGTGCRSGAVPGLDRRRDGGDQRRRLMGKGERSQRRRLHRRARDTAHARFRRREAARLAVDVIADAFAAH